MSIELDRRAPAHQLEDAIKKVESSARREWPVYREITRQERADRASAELLVESERRREFQRQNDKFIGREPKVGRTRMVLLKYFTTQAAPNQPQNYLGNFPGQGHTLAFLVLL